MVWPSKSAITRIWAVRGARLSTISRMAEGNTLAPRTINMSSVRPTQRMRGPVRPQGQSMPSTSIWSPERKRRRGEAWRWRAV